MMEEPSSLYQGDPSESPGLLNSEGNNAHLGFDEGEGQDFEGEKSRPAFFGYIPRIFRFDKAPTEATGISMNVSARATLLISGVFVGPCLLELATAAALENCSSDDDQACAQDPKIYGFKPSSLLTISAIVAGLVSAVLLPVAGAVIDHTRHRRQVGAYSALLLAIIKVVELGISSRTWFYVTILQVISFVLFQLLTVTEYAYSAELSSDPAEQSYYQTYFFFVLFVSLILYMLTILIPGHLLGLGDLDTARLAIAVSVIVSIPMFTICWKYLFPDRPALSRVPANQSLLTTGFRRLYETSKTIRSNLPAVKWFLIAIVFSEAANQAVNTIFTTYCKLYLEMTSLQIGMVILLLLLGGVPGTFIGRRISTKYNPVISAQVCLVVYIATTLAASLHLRPESKNFALLYGFLWGICKGWLHPIHTTIFVTISPKGQEVEMMGLYFFACQILTFLPPLVFTVLNENGQSMSLGMASLTIYFALGLLGLNFIGNYQEAVNTVTDSQKTSN
jgi:UMF1 family MFS transporter